MLLTSRKLLQSKPLDIENELRGTLRNFGLKVGTVSKRHFEARICELVGAHPRLAAIVEPILTARTSLRTQADALHKMLLDLVRNDPVCRRLMSVPGVGPVVAMIYRATINVPARFAKSRSVDAHCGLTPRQYQSGEIDWTGRISKCGDEVLRVALYEAAQVLMTRSDRWSYLKAWGFQVARRRGRQKAIVAVARRLAVILHRMWVDGSEFRWGRQPAAA
jgi:transposase